MGKKKAHLSQKMGFRPLKELWKDCHPTATLELPSLNRLPETLSISFTKNPLRWSAEGGEQ